MVELKDDPASGKTYLNLAGCHSTEHGSDECGYCKDKNKPGVKGHKSWGITSEKMPVGDY